MATKKSYIGYQITAGGGNITRPVEEVCDGYLITAEGGAVTLGADMVFDVSGTPKIGDTVVFYYGGMVDTQAGLYKVQVNSFILDEYQALVPLRLEGIFNGTTWDMYVTPSLYPVVGYLYDGGFITPLSIKNASVKNDELTLGKLEVITPAEFVVGAAGGNTTVPFSGDMLVNEAGVATLQDNAITDALKVGVRDVTVSFETGEQGSYKLYMPFAGSVTFISAEVIAQNDFLR